MWWARLSRYSCVGAGWCNRNLASGSKLAAQSAKTRNELANNTKTEETIRLIVKNNISRPYVESGCPPPRGSHAHMSVGTSRKGPQIRRRTRGHGAGGDVLRWRAVRVLRPPERGSGGRSTTVVQ